MVRPRKVNKVPKTTLAISEKTLQEMVVFKPSNVSWDDFITSMWRQNKNLRATNFDLEDALKTERARNEVLNKQLYDSNTKKVIAK